MSVPAKPRGDRHRIGLEPGVCGDRGGLVPVEDVGHHAVFLEPGTHQRQHVPACARQNGIFDLTGATCDSIILILG
jgi:hypothetical protein